MNFKLRKFNKTNRQKKRCMKSIFKNKLEDGNNYTKEKKYNVKMRLKIG